MKLPHATKKQRSRLKAIRRLWIACLFCVLLAPVEASAVTLAEYRENISHIREDISQMLSPEDGSTPDEINDFEQEVADELEEIIPVSETVEWDGASLETDNQWLHAKFKEYRNEPKDSARRTAILHEIYERLTAIEARIGELESAVDSGRSKDEDKQKLAEILRREEYRKPEEPEETFIQSLINKIAEWIDWLFGSFPRANVPAGSAEGLRPVSFILQILLFVAVFGLIGFFVYRFAPFLFRRFRSREKQEKTERVILGETLAADETAQNLFSQAELLAREGRLRDAIRKGYIALLCELSDRKVIGLARHKTNRDYLREVSRRRGLHQKMNSLTGKYERHWYGLDEASEEDWNEFRQGYREAVSSEQ